MLKREGGWSWLSWVWVLHTHGKKGFGPKRQTHPEAPAHGQHDEIQKPVCVWVFTADASIPSLCLILAAAHISPYAPAYLRQKEKGG